MIKVQDVLDVSNPDLELDVSKFKLSPEARLALLNLRTQAIADKLVVNAAMFTKDPESLTVVLMRADIELATYDYLLELNTTNQAISE